MMMGGPLVQYLFLSVSGMINFKKDTFLPVANLSLYSFDKGGKVSGLKFTKMLREVKISNNFNFSLWFEIIMQRFVNKLFLSLYFPFLAPTVATLKESIELKQPLFYHYQGVRVEPESYLSE